MPRQVLGWKQEQAGVGPVPCLPVPGAKHIQPLSPHPPCLETRRDQVEEDLRNPQSQQEDGVLITREFLECPLMAAPYKEAHASRLFGADTVGRHRDRWKMKGIRR